MWLKGSNLTKGVFIVVQACGPIQSFKRLITPANKPQGFGFAEFQDPDSALRAMDLLNNVELPALEDGCVNKKLLVSGSKPAVRQETIAENGAGQSRRTDKSLPGCILRAEDEDGRTWPYSIS